MTLAPAAAGQVVTSERGEVVSVNPDRHALIIRLDDGRFERLEGHELAKDRLAHGYAVTVHRAQASTVDVAHRYEDGGGRALGYVSMSRGRACNTVHVVADSVDQAAEDLTRDWSVDHRARWAIDSGTPPPTPSPSNTTTGPQPGCAPPSTTPASKPNGKPSPPPSHPTRVPSSPRLRGNSPSSTGTAPTCLPATAATPVPPKVAPSAVSPGPPAAPRRPVPRRGVRQLARPPPLAQGSIPLG